MMKNVAIIVLAAAFIVLLFFKIEDDDRKSFLEYDTRRKIDSVKTKYRELIREDSITFIEYQKLAHQYHREKENAIAWQKKYEREKNKPVIRYNDLQLDSLLLSIR